MTIISHKNKFVFIKSRKTAGTSISVPFAEICGPDDILPLSQDVIDNFGLERRNTRREFRSMSVHSLSRHFYYVLRNFKDKTLTDFFRPTYQQHMTVSELKEALGREVWNNYYKFTIERNPYDRLVSFYNWRKHRFGLSVSFEDFAWAVFDNKSELRRYTHGFSNRPFYLDQSNQICVDKVILFEDMQKGIKDVFTSLGLNDFEYNEPPNLKGGIRKDKEYRMFYSKKLLERAREEFALEEKLFGYEF